MVPLLPRLHDCRRTIAGSMREARHAGSQPATLAIRTRIAAAPVRREIADLDRQLALESIETLDDWLGQSVAPRRFSVLALSAFAAGSLLLSAIGLYGLLAFTVAERRREIAVRLALGAGPPAILRMVVGQGLRPVALGLVAGAIVSFWVARALTTLLYRTDAHDVMTFASVPAVLLLISLAACALPALRASRVEPITSLRSE